MKRVDLTGKKLGKITVLSLSHKEKRMFFWKCKCDCGKEFYRATNELNRNRAPIPSCGCYHSPNSLPKDRFMKFVDKTETCWLWKGFIFSTGYGEFHLNKKTTTSHRASWLLHKGEIPNGLIICHTCDNPKCVNPAHLFLGTHKDNSQDMSKKGRSCKFLKNASGKIDENQSNLIYDLYKNGETQRKIAKDFGIHQSTVWKHIRKKIPSEGKMVGEKNNKSIFNENEILKIRSSYIPYKMSYAKLAKIYKVNVSTIFRIINKITWTHI
jgi:hypothetical protein